MQPTFRRYISWTSLLILAWCLPQCKPNTTAPVTPATIPNPGQVGATVQVDLPGQVDLSKIRFVAGLNVGTLTKSGGRQGARQSGTYGEFKIGLTQNAVQVIMGLDAENRPVCMAQVNTKYDNPTSLSINVQTTANTLLLMSPTLLTADPDDNKTIRDKVQGSATARKLYDDLTNYMTGVTTASFIPNLLDPLNLKRFDLVKAWQELDAQFFTRVTLPADDVNGIRFNTFSEEKSTGKLTFQFENSRRRWVMIAVDKYKNGQLSQSDAFDLTRDADFTKYLVPSPDDYGIVDIYNRYANKQRNVYASPTLTSETQTFDRVDVNLYSLGFRSFPKGSTAEQDRAFRRMMLPSALSAAFNGVIPLMEMLIGFDISAESFVGKKIEGSNRKLLINLLDSFIRDQTVQTDWRELLFNNEQVDEDFLKKLLRKTGESAYDFFADPDNQTLLVSAMREWARDLIVGQASEQLVLDRINQFYSNASPWLKAYDLLIKGYNIADFVYDISTGASVMSYPYFPGATIELDKGLLLSFSFENSLTPGGSLKATPQVTGTLTYADGVTGKAMEVKHTGYLASGAVVPVNTTLNSLWTTSYWVKRNVPDNTKRTEIYTTYDKDDGSWLASGFFAADAFSTGGYADRASCRTSYDYTPNDNVNGYVHVVSSFGNGFERTYYNGKLVSSMRCDFLTMNRLQTLYFGFDPHNGDYQYDGKLDEYRLYNRTLSEAEINELYLRAKRSGRTTASQPASVGQSAPVTLMGNR
ncbi:LamG domain-containing protein [Fibrella forsythiae]|uniref:LamG domain-containing protein n=1 Tax=Fibrella forsythiae TaxID=2817061 RepID=A0ABS3JPA7_9BACT|nr:LamG domain-containing protein [Fibrella forsythiae]MBO0951829.1 LamG domain-containing protein [Fibrella forsythiae]